MTTDHQPAPAAPSSPAATAGRTPEPDQSFLVGESIYLRPLELADAATAMLWRPEPYPVPVEVMEERLKEEEKAEDDKMRLLLCRRGEDVPIGYAETQTHDDRTVTLTYHVAPILGPAAISAIAVELLGLMVPWLLHEHDYMSVRVDTVAGDPALERAADALEEVR